MRLDFYTHTCNSDGDPIEGTATPHTLLFNTKVISRDEIRQLINNDEWEYDKRVVVTTPDRADALKGII